MSRASYVFVVVPLWRVSEVHSPPPTGTAMAAEDTSDESFAKRHSKPENEEKRRKRSVWYFMFLLEHDQLLSL